MVCKIHALSKGFSGISLDVVERLMLMLEKDIIPVVPEQGSVGASGDLAPLFISFGFTTFRFRKSLGRRKYSRNCPSFRKTSITTFKITS